VDVDFTATMEGKLDEVESGDRPWVPVVREFFVPFHEEVVRAGESIERIKIEPELTDELCENCGRPMAIRMGRFGKFLGCSGFPECRTARPILNKLGIPCPTCGADLVERRTRQRRIFYGCSRYPDCDWTSWQRPLPEPCPNCGGLMVEVGKSGARCTKCGAGDAQDAAPSSAPAARPTQSGRTRKKSA
jgi:DNA topoisomerase I